VEILAFAKVAGHHIITWLIIGLVASLVVSRVVRGTGLGMVRDIIVGLVGAVIGGGILHAVRGGSHASPSVLVEIVVAFVGAVILLIIAKQWTADAPAGSHWLYPVGCDEHHAVPCSAMRSSRAIRVDDRGVDRSIERR
jgi:uncharacterized membrane protein YeaQ/YmgE (transglycosylase-associated protein family)